MTVDRRHVLAGAGMLAVGAAFIAAPSWLRAGSTALVLPPVAAGRDILFIHDDRGASLDVADRLRIAAYPGTVTMHAVAMLDRGGYRQAAHLLDRSRGVAIVTLLDAGPALVLDRLAEARGIALLGVMKERR